MCRIMNNISAVEAKKCIVLADCPPPKIFNRNGYEAAIAGDMVIPVVTMTGIKTNMTMR